MRYGSVCSGIEAASVAWSPIGWEPAWFAEIEPFPSSVLAHHYPEVPNLGDMTEIAARISAGEIEAPDVLVGGTPCQSFSVAGMRGGLKDARGQLTLSFVEIADAIDAARYVRGQSPAVIVWENVPGALSSRDNAFGCFLGALAGEDCELQPPGKRWANAGCVFGPKRAIAWRVLDAQYFGVAQRRRRVFVVASARDGFDPAAVLFESEGVRRDSPPSREPGQGFAADVAPSLTASGRGVERIGETRGQDPVIAQCITGNVTHTLRAEGFDASEDGTGRGHPIVPTVAFTAINDGGDCQADVTPTLTCGGGGGHEVAMAVAFVQNSRDEVRLMGGDGQIVGALAAETGAKQQCYVAQAVAIRTANTGANGHGISPEVSHTLDRANGQAVAVSLRGRDSGATAELGDEVGNCLRASSGGGDKPYVLAPAIALQTDVTPKASEEIAFTLKLPSASGGGQPAACMTPQMAVRRLTAKECERLQGFPDNYTLIPYRGKPAADGPRYKALGNSMAVPVMTWIGRRIKEAE